MCRQIDCVTVKGSIKPLELWTVDLWFDDLEEKEDRLKGLGIKEKKSVRDKEKRSILDKVFYGKKTPYQILINDKEFIEMRQKIDSVFQSKYEQAYQKYISGDWASAEDLFAQCLKLDPKDGPTITLKGYIEDLNGRAPDNWKGFRELTEK